MPTSNKPSSTRKQLRIAIARKVYGGVTLGIAALSVIATLQTVRCLWTAFENHFPALVTLAFCVSGLFLAALIALLWLIRNKLFPDMLATWANRTADQDRQADRMRLD